MWQEIGTLSMNNQSSSCVQIFAPFTKHIDGATIDDAEYLDLLFADVSFIWIQLKLFCHDRVVHGFIRNI